MCACVCYFQHFVDVCIFNQGPVKHLSHWKVVAESGKTPRFLASREFNLGPEMRLDRSELLCNKVLLKYKGDRETSDIDIRSGQNTHLLVFSYANVLRLYPKLCLQVGSASWPRTYLTSMLYSDIVPLIYVNETICMVICLSTRFKSTILWPGMTRLVPRLSKIRLVGEGPGAILWVLRHSFLSLTDC